MPHVKDLFQHSQIALPLTTPTVNYYDWFLGRPELKSWPNYTVHIDPVTGERRRLRFLLDRLEQAATALVSSPSDGGLGFAAGQSGIVGILSENCLEYPVLVFALLKIAVPMALFPSHSTLHETAALLKMTGITSLFVSEARYPHVIAAVKEAGLPEDRVFILQGDVPGKVSLPRLIEGVKSRGLPRVPTQTVRDDTVAYLVFSSGTTGLPKAVMISHRNLMFATSQTFVVLEELIKLGAPPPFPTPEKIPVHLAVVPWYHAMGAHGHVFRLFASPATFVIASSWNPDHIVKIFSQYTITHFLMAPSMTYQMLHDPKLAKVNLDSLMSASAGSAHIPPELRTSFERKAKNVLHLLEGYGMSEFTFGAIYSPVPGMFGGHIENVRGMTGVLFPYVEARILREDGSDADYDEVGELLLRSPTTALGYLNNEKATKETFVDGWLHTGDRFYVDKQERFFYVDRIKDILKVSGKQVSPTEIEDTILEHPSQLINEVAVAGIKGNRMSDELVPRAWVVLSALGKQKGAEAVFVALEEWTRSRLSKHKWLRGGLQIVDEIPKSPTGKVLRRKLQDEYARSEPEGARAKTQAKL
ncbi:acetyl-CoA synthetase-like protein [Lactarius indigo]|nr:acetyl-CoA synthetase-like protein [Lactarius indigo]